MASSSGGSSSLDEDLVSVMDQKKRKRMLSNRESARRSRMRKTKHLDDLMAEISRLRETNSQIKTTLNLYTQNHLVLDTKNSVLKTQAIELTSRLNSLNDILFYLNLNNSFINPQMLASDWFINPLSSLLFNQSSMASPNMLHQHY